MSRISTIRFTDTTNTRLSVFTTKVLKPAIRNITQHPLVITRRPDGWIVEFPDTGVAGRAAMMAHRASGENSGFFVEHTKSNTGRWRLSFHHPKAQFDDWVCGHVMEQISDRLGYPIYDEEGLVTSREYGRGRTFLEYLARNFAKPFTGSDSEFFNTIFLPSVPESMRAEQWRLPD